MFFFKRNSSKSLNFVTISFDLTEIRAASRYDSIKMRGTLKKNATVDLPEYAKTYRLSDNDYLNYSLLAILF